MNQQRSFLIFRNGSIGNTLMAVPAIRAIRAVFPESQITAVVDGIGAQLLEHCPYIDRLIVYEKVSGTLGLREFTRVVREARSANPTHAVLFKRFFRNGLIAFLAGAPTRIGFSTNGKRPFLNCTVPYDLQTHIAQLDLKLAALAGATSSDDSLEVFLSSDDEAFGDVWRSENNLLPREYICAHYGGVSVGSKFMSLPTFAELLLQRRSNKTVVFLGSGEQETADAYALSKLLPKSHYAVNLPIRHAIAILKRAAAFAGFNSGPAHLAAACKLPGLVIFPHDVYQKDAVRWRPLHEELRVIAAHRELSNDEWKDWLRDSPPLIP